MRVFAISISSLGSGAAKPSKHTQWPLPFRLVFEFLTLGAKISRLGGIQDTGCLDVLEFLNVFIMLATVCLFSRSTAIRQASDAPRGSLVTSTRANLKIRLRTCHVKNQNSPRM